MSPPTSLQDAPRLHTEVGITGQTVTTRVLSLDIFRGFTMAVMIFVNDLSDVQGLPAWTHHYPRDINAMSYVDMVYPFFLFAVGLSLPLAIQQRLRRDPSLPGLWWHILLRCCALLGLGLILANAQSVNALATHMRGSLWALLALLGGGLVLNVYPNGLSRLIVLILRSLGAVLVVTMFAIFRRQLPDGQLAWIDFSYPEILGLIALTYLAACLLYIPTRRLRWAPLGWFALLLLFNIACLAHWIASPVDRATMYGFPFDNGAMASIVMAGVVVSSLFLSEKLRTDPRRQFALGFAFAAVAALLGLLLRPLGISKIRATPTWALWSIAAATAVFMLFYFLLDLRRRTRWSRPFRAPGANTLLTYLLPDLFYYSVAFLHLGKAIGRYNQGRSGVLRALCFTGVIVGLSYLFTRARLRLQL